MDYSVEHLMREIAEGSRGCEQCGALFDASHETCPVCGRDLDRYEDQEEPL